MVHAFAELLVEVAQEVAIDDANRYPEELSVTPVDAPGEEQAPDIRHLAFIGNADEQAAVVVLAEMLKKVPAADIQIDDGAPAGPVDQLAVGAGQGDSVRHGNIVNALRQQVLHVPRSQPTAEIHLVFDVVPINSGLYLLEDQVDHLHVARRLLGQNHAEAPHVVLAVLERLCAVVPGRRAGHGGHEPHDQGADQSDGAPGP